jgi:hypothetical protein
MMSDERAQGETLRDKGKWKDEEKGRRRGNRKGAEGRVMNERELQRDGRYGEIRAMER